VPDGEDRLTRRGFLRAALRGACAAGLGAAGLGAARKALAEGRVWQLDPHKCVQCGKCATACVLAESAVKCVHAYAMCGYCDFCTGFFEPQPNQRTAAAENQLCPTGAIVRTYVQRPYYQYTIDEKACIGCARCVKGCSEQGNGSLFLQVRHDRCLNCNECSIAKACPSGAFRRVPASRPYLLKKREAPPPASKKEPPA
jgi:Na+-translocating ferredoxin:NAD+ oxidoreductase subunit B